MVKLKKEENSVQEILNVENLWSLAGMDPVGWEHVKPLGISESTAGMTMIAPEDFHVEQSNAEDFGHLMPMETQIILMG